MYRKYIFCKNNYLNILIFSILIFCIIIGLNIYENMESKIKSEDLPENRTFLITFRNIINIEKTLEKCNNIVEYEQISYVNKNSQNIEIYEVILDKEESISIIEKELNGKSIKIKKKYENNILSDKLANLLYKIIRYYLIIVYIFMIIINYFFISKIIVSEKKNIAILKAIGYTENHISIIVLKLIMIDLVTSFFISNTLYFIIQQNFGEIFDNFINIKGILNYNSNTIIISIIIIFIISILSVIANKFKLQRTTPMTLFYED